MKIKHLFVVSTILLGALGLRAELLEGATSAPTTVDDLVSKVKGGDFLLLGEVHGSKQAQAFQMQILNALRAKGMLVQVGMEFIEYPYQSALEYYNKGRISEANFLKFIKWSGFPFELYRDQILFPDAKKNEGVFGVNAPRRVTSYVAKNGLAGMPAELANLMPPSFTRGRDSYFVRFQEAMGGHLPSPDALENYFLAQSIWDDTMAWKSLEGQSSNPQAVFVVVVGEFHVAYGGGLPDRLKARGAGKVWTLSQVNTEGLSEAEIKGLVQPHPRDGVRADWVHLLKEVL